MKKQSIRDKLANTSRAFRETLEMYYSKPNLETNLEDRDQQIHKLIHALRSFENNPTNLHSIVSKGLAELIYDALPAKCIEKEKDTYFKLNSDKIKPFKSYDLAKIFESAYKYEALNNTVGVSVVDRLYSEISSFFLGMQLMLRREETNIALQASIKDGYDIIKSESEYLDAAKRRDPDITNLFVLKNCDYCFRLVHMRSGDTKKTTTGTTCLLHSSDDNFNLYRRTKDKFDEYHHSGGNKHELPFSIIVKLQVLSASSLMYDSPWSSDELFEAALQALQSPPSRQVFTPYLKKLKTLITNSFPEIASPWIIIKKMEEFENKNSLAPKQLQKLLADFMKEPALPFHPELTALHLVFFLGESWYAQDYDAYYYSDKKTSIGRPHKVDHAAIREAAARLFNENPKLKRKIASMLADQFNCDRKTIRNILKDKL